MNVIRKIKTAFTVLHNFGIREVFGLLRDNFKKFSFYAKHFALELFNRATGNALLRITSRRSNRMKVLFVTSNFETFHSQTVRYRIYNFRQALQGRAYTRFEVLESGVYQNMKLLEWADIVILMRTTWTAETEKLISAAKNLNKPTVFDVDDLIFLPCYVEHYCHALGDMSRENIKARRKEFEGFEKTFKNCDFATASTNYIAEKMESAGKRSFVIHNGLNKKQINIARRVRKREDGVRAVGYLSGTKTHDKDFEQAMPALERIVSEYPDVVLRTAGYISLSASPVLERKIQHACYMNWTRLMEYGAQNYINIAPLDIKNPFCHAKSELKYFEAAIAGVPTVASNTDTFTRCIKNGVNGFLAENEEQWYQSIKALLDDKKLYKCISENAREDALKNYSPSATASEALSAYGEIIKKRKTLYSTL